MPTTVSGGRKVFLASGRRRPVGETTRCSGRERAGWRWGASLRTTYKRGFGIMSTLRIGEDAFVAYGFIELGA